jgi:hypothetical protein
MRTSARFARSSRSAADTALLRAREGYFTWLDHIWSAAGCTHPVRLHGDVRVYRPPDRRSAALTVHQDHAGPGDL